jgi:hypothetical protein
VAKEVEGVGGEGEVVCTSNLFFCRISLMIHGSGSRTLTAATLSGEQSDFDFSGFGFHG